MPISKTKNENFFKKWSSEMAYVLGFFAADGNLTIGKRGNYYVEFNSTDRVIIEEIRKIIGSSYKIGIRKRNKNWKESFRIQIGSKIMCYDLVKLGFMPNKSKQLSFPLVPIKYLCYFIRGYFDGDGGVWIGLVHKKRNTPTPTIRVSFTSGSRNFIKGLKEILCENLNIAGFINYHDRAYRLYYSTRASLILFNFMYNDTTAFCLSRKKKIFESYIQNGVVV